MSLKSNRLIHFILAIANNLYYRIDMSLNHFIALLALLFKTWLDSWISLVTYHDLKMRMCFQELLFDCLLRLFGLLWLIISYLKVTYRSNFLNLATYISIQSAYLVFRPFLWLFAKNNNDRLHNEVKKDFDPHERANCNKISQIIFTTEGALAVYHLNCDTNCQCRNY